MLFIYLNILSSYPIEMRENVIRNDCEFEIIRFKKRDLDCMDYGKNVEYCNYYGMYDEYVVTKEKGINLKPVFTIKPDSLYERSNYHKIKLADFYYEFSCNSEDNEAKLLLTIVPVNDYSAFISCLYFIGLLIFIMSTMTIISNETNKLQKVYIYQYNK